MAFQHVDDFQSSVCKGSNIYGSSLQNRREFCILERKMERKTREWVRRMNMIAISARDLLNYIICRKMM